MFKKIIPHIVAFLFLAGFVAYAWTEPSSAPPADNVSTPINVGSASQYKSGAFGLGGLLHAFSDVIIDGKVGIGTASPQGKLDINGSLAIGGNQGAAGQILQSQGSGMSPLWSNAQVKVVNGPYCPAGYSATSYYYQSRTCTASYGGCASSVCTTGSGWAPGTNINFVNVNPGPVYFTESVPTVPSCFYFQNGGGGACIPTACYANVVLRTTCAVDNP